MKLLSQQDPEIYRSIQNEINRQNTNLELIASENFVSQAVLEALGNVMTNKYAEGYPGKRYYGGCEFVDDAERLAIDRVKKLFAADFANVQPHSGASANLAVYLTLCDPGDTIMGMNLSHGGHLTHGSPVNFSGGLYKVVAYGVNPETGYLDMEGVYKLAKEHKPKMIMTGASAYPRFWDFKRFREIADEVGAYLVADIAHPAGLVATHLHPDPLPYCHVVTSTTHKTLRGPRGGLLISGGGASGVEIMDKWMGKKKTIPQALDSKVFPGAQGGPLMHVIAAKAVAFLEALEPSFKVYSEQIVKNAQTLAKTLVDFGYKLVSNGTDNHLMLVDLSPKNITGKAAQEALEPSGITVNKNTVPNEKQSPFVTSGIRIGTPAVTTRGMKEPEMKMIGSLINEVLIHLNDQATYQNVREKVTELCKAFPLYEDR